MRRRMPPPRQTPHLRRPLPVQGMPARQVVGLWGRVYTQVPHELPRLPVLLRTLLRVPAKPVNTMCDVQSSDLLCAHLQVGP